MKRIWGWKWSLVRVNWGLPTPQRRTRKALMNSKASALLTWENSLPSRNSTDKSPTIKPFHSLINLSSKYLKTFPNPRFAGRAHTAPRFTNLVFQRAFWFRILIVFKCSCLRLSAPRCTYRKNIALNIYKSRRTRGGGWMEATPCSHSSACFILENLCSAFDTVWARR